MYVLIIMLFFIYNTFSFTCGRRKIPIKVWNVYCEAEILSHHYVHILHLIKKGLYHLLLPLEHDALEPVALEHDVLEHHVLEHDALEHDALEHDVLQHCSLLVHVLEHDAHKLCWCLKYMLTVYTWNEEKKILNLIYMAPIHIYLLYDKPTRVID